MDQVLLIVNETISSILWGEELVIVGCARHTIKAVVGGARPTKRRQSCDG